MKNDAGDDVPDPFLEVDDIDHYDPPGEATVHVIGFDPSHNDFKYNGTEPCPFTEIGLSLLSVFLNFLELLGDYEEETNQKLYPIND